MKCYLIYFHHGVKRIQNPIKTSIYHTNIIVERKINVSRDKQRRTTNILIVKDNVFAVVIGHLLSI